ncbi:MAG TPA: UDP-glucose/GDP-mannose dehydrogenase family protein [Candidatus Acidoferrum sp.]|nr:UDP-glucose/GDP-mannose dehydrogenase family protein [Candidatus Acidoferrum sp.]
MKRKVSIFGLGYVGSVTAACLAKQGHSIVGVDLSAAKVALLEAGQSPIVEAELDQIVKTARSESRLRATTDTRSAITDTEISLICVGTPSLPNGKLDLSHIERVCREIGEVLKQKNQFHWIVIRSTVLPGTTESVVIPALEDESGKRSGESFAVCYNPEFMREGTAVADFFAPPFTVLGASDAKFLQPLRELYEGIGARVFETSIATAEMVKYTCNTFHAIKVGFANEIGTICKSLNVDAKAVTDIFTSDTRLNISTAYLSPGFAFGGSCLPKDLRALMYKAKELDLQLPLLGNVLSSNTAHIERTVEAVLNTNSRKVGVLGLSFKSGTDDLRESPLVQLIKRLLGEGLEIQIWDRDVSLGQLVGSNRKYIEDVIPHIGSLLRSTIEEVVSGAEVILLGTKTADRQSLQSLLQPKHTVIDLVHLNPSQRPSGNFQYEGICW